MQIHRTMIVLEGLALIILGMVGFFLPIIMSSFGIETLVGTILFIAGCFQLMPAIKARVYVGFQALATAFIYLIIGLVLLFYRVPNEGLVLLTYPVSRDDALALVVILFFLFEGITKLSWGFTLKPVRGSGWIIFNGILGLIMAALLLLPGSGTWALGLLIGIDLIFFGFALITLALYLPLTKE